MGRWIGELQVVSVSMGGAIPDRARSMPGTIHEVVTVDQWDLLNEVARFLTAREMADSGVVAVSGGPDSVALLRALLVIRPPTTPLVMAHLNHQLRGSESDGDEAFVVALHTRLSGSGMTGLALRTARRDVAQQAHTDRDNLECTGRRLRYEWLAGVAREVGATWVAIGHTADDQAETVLHRLLRGTGLHGLRGIPARRPLALGIEVVRPFLRVSRREVLDYLAALGQDFREDRSNVDPQFTRNRLRHDLLPKLAAEYNPAISAVLGRLAEQAAEVQREQEQAADALLIEAELPRAGDIVVLDAARLAVAPRHRVRELLRLVWTRERWPLNGMSYEHWDRVAAVALGEMAAIDLPEGLRARRMGRVLQLRRA